MLDERHADGAGLHRAAVEGDVEVALHLLGRALRRHIQIAVGSKRVKQRVCAVQRLHELDNVAWVAGAARGVPLHTKIAQRSAEEVSGEVQVAVVDVRRSEIVAAVAVAVRDPRVLGGVVEVRHHLRDAKLSMAIIAPSSDPPLHWYGSPAMMPPALTSELSPSAQPSQRRR